MLFLAGLLFQRLIAGDQCPGDHLFQHLAQGLVEGDGDGLDGILLGGDQRSAAPIADDHPPGHANQLAVEGHLGFRFAAIEVGSLKLPNLDQQQELGAQADGAAAHADNASRVLEGFNDQGLNHPGDGINPVGAGVVLDFVTAAAEGDPRGVEAGVG